jgi:UDP-N-acetylglucosamine 2-epimerase (non-hydrolysing)/UDP-GlcNAc:undecaprenyl-phosphate GlcNAc-1-phosphate transferase
MSQISVMLLFGARPDAIKMAPLVKKLQDEPDIFQTTVCVTAQHRQMLDQVLNAFAITPDIDLDLMSPRQTLSGLAKRILESLDPVLEANKPDIVLVHGDTLSCLIGSLVAFFHQIKVGHVEAGLRTYDKYAPFPEEINRQMTSRIADYHYAPTMANRSALLAEGIDGTRIFVTGNTAIDALATTVSQNYRFNDDRLQQLVDQKRQILTVTAHRRENLGEPLRQIALALCDIAKANPKIAICYALHLNPVIRETVLPILSDLSNVYLIDPPDVVEMHNLMAASYLILTDSGGLQEEAPALGKPVLVLRDVTERQEAVEAKTVLLVGPHRKTIFAETQKLLHETAAYSKMARAINPYGDGRAAERISEALKFSFGKRSNRPDDFCGLV